ncbi:prepilin-type N-terminal cleavage/methylation domain-containing protein [Shewanella youngdeokensis]|uniref:Prepilin-type N-terminal cleavage/methylation domain-containing protein n=1 Tax=Shewanella youngdeokensis TaxID=2999068 RepID=A0ABZ0JV07_9GAMM|nr:prepilin-type N-terminal cleavage/methylation domain-containing protein [Shewanella sp. DAU334]
MVSVRRKAGFTFIELVVVILVLVLLSLGAAPKFLDFRDNAKIAILEEIAGAMHNGLALVHSKAAVEGQDSAVGSIVHAGVTIPLYNGYPSVDGSDTFRQLNTQIQAWLDIDSVSLTDIKINNDAAAFFVDKSSRNNQIYLFFAEDLADKKVSFKCHIMYQNITTENGYEISVETDDC